MAVFFVFSQVLTVYQLVSQRVLTWSHLRYDAVGLPAAALGLSVGVALYNRIDQVAGTGLEPRCT